MQGLRFISVLLFSLFVFESRGDNCSNVDRYKATFTEFPKHTPTDKTVDAPITGNGDIGLTMAPSAGKIVFYIGKNDFWKAVESIPDGKIALPGGLTIKSDIFQEKGYYAEQLPGSGEIKAVFRRNDNELKLSAWVAALDNNIVIELEVSKQTKINLNLWAQEGSDSKTSKAVEAGCQWVHRSFDNLPYLKWPTYMAVAMNQKNGDLVLESGQKVWIVSAIYTNHDTEKWHELSIARVSNITDVSISEKKKQHHEWWNNFWGLSNVSIDDEMLMKYYYQSQYIFACASREGKFAPGIWGPFITSDEPAWRGDYHLNYNFESPYWASFSSNHICLTENYEQPMLDYMEKGRQHAHNLLGCRGILYPVGLGPKGLCSSAWPKSTEKMKSMYGYADNTIEDGVAFWQQKTNASFVAANMMMHFYSTYDVEYAKKIYPFVRACADFWEDFLVYENGRYVVKGDVFTETAPWKKYEGDYNCVVSLGMARMIFQSAEKLSVFLKVDARKRASWKRIQNRLSDFPVGKNAEGRTSLCAKETPEMITSGTYAIHMHGVLYPTGLTGPTLNSDYNTIMLNDLLSKKITNTNDWGSTIGNGIETLYPGSVRVGYPARQLLSHLRNRIKLASYPNCYIIANGGGIETTSTVPSTINEMMIQSYEGIVRVFPNWDRSLNANFENLRAYGAFLVSSSIHSGNINNVTIKSEKGRLCKFENPWASEQLIVYRNGKKWKVLDGKIVNFKTRSGDVYEITRNSI